MNFNFIRDHLDRYMESIYARRRPRKFMNTPIWVLEQFGAELKLCAYSNEMEAIIKDM